MDRAAMTVERRGPSGGDGREDDVVPGRGGDGREDGAIPGHGGDGRVAWTRRR
jgi:hypothetical protein